MSGQVVFQEYEVFIQRDHGSPHEHAGSLLAGDPEEALLLARENFLRRDPAVSIWVVNRAHIQTTASGHPDFLAREIDRSYRTVAGYKANVEKWRKYSRQPLTLQELVKDES